MVFSPIVVFVFIMIVVTVLVFMFGMFYVSITQYEVKRRDKEISLFEGLKCAAREAAQNPGPNK